MSGKADFRLIPVAFPPHIRFRYHCIAKGIYSNVIGSYVSGACKFNIFELARAFFVHHLFPLRFLSCV